MPKPQPSMPGPRSGDLLVAVALATIVALSAAMIGGCQDKKPSAVAAADNSGINKRDTGQRTMTPIDQSQDSVELERVAMLRRALMELPNLSMAGQNIKIITREGRVTLRGPVPDQAELSRIEQVLTKAAGKASVDSQLEVAPAP